MELTDIDWRLRGEVAGFTFAAPVSYVYNPLIYAWEPHRLYLERYGRGHPEVVLLGMNPGPFGMAQTGVPFGDVDMVRDWLGIEAPVGKPEREHPKRPVTGFACRRGEVSGRRLWGWTRARFGTPEQFFARFFVANYCPLCFLTESGRNLTPDRLPRAEQEELFAACDRALRATFERLEPRFAIGIGRFAAERARFVAQGLPIRLGCAPHPSPANPTANRNWEELMEQALHDLGVALP
jgi:single-strand selective monofunctional uracil DNA glycosylase